MKHYQIKIKEKGMISFNMAKTENIISLPLAILMLRRCSEIFSRNQVLILQKTNNFLNRFIRIGAKEREDLPLALCLWKIAFSLLGLGIECHHLAHHPIS